MTNLVNHTFEERLSKVTDIHHVARMMDDIVAAHKSLQLCEAGASPTIAERGDAIFRFLDIFGYYPQTFLGKDVLRIGLFFDENDGLLKVSVKLDGFGWTNTALFPGHLEPSIFIIKSIIREAFPKSVIDMTSDYGLEEELTHVSVRETYMPDKGQISPSGSATCSDAKIALMQAAVRMVNALVLGRIAATYTPQMGTQVAIRPKRIYMVSNPIKRENVDEWITRTLRQKQEKLDEYCLADVDFSEAEKQMMAFFNVPEQACSYQGGVKTGRWSGRYSDFVKQSRAMAEQSKDRLHREVIDEGFYMKPSAERKVGKLEVLAMGYGRSGPVKYRTFDKPGGNFTMVVEGPNTLAKARMTAKQFYGYEGKLWINVNPNARTNAAPNPLKLPPIRVYRLDDGKYWQTHYHPEVTKRYLKDTRGYEGDLWVICND